MQHPDQPQPNEPTVAPLGQQPPSYPPNVHPQGNAPHPNAQPQGFSPQGAPPHGAYPQFPPPHQPHGAPYAPPHQPTPPSNNGKLIGVGLGVAALMGVAGLGAGLVMSGRNAPPPAAPTVAIATPVPVTEAAPDTAPTAADAPTPEPTAASGAVSIPEGPSADRPDGGTPAPDGTTITEAAPAPTQSRAGASTSGGAAGMGEAEPIIASFDNQTTIRARTNGQKPMTVYINGRKVAEFQDSLSLDISKMVKPGQNTVRAVWSEPIGFSSVRIAHAKMRNKFGTLVDVDIDQEGNRAGEKSATFFMPSS